MRTLIAGRKLQALLNVVRKCRKVPGIGVELGVYQGGSLKAMAQADSTRNYFGFDTFEGLPEQSWDESEVHVPGEFSDTHFDAVKKRLPRNVQLKQGIFPLSASDLDLSEIAVAHVDFDFYESTRAAIEWLLPRMSSGGAIVFDDYEWRNCPGVKRAIDEAGLKVDTRHKHQAIYWVRK
ncbi:TylF/MycF/NovP-related O-methyltransferase [Orrella sp. 11846]|uniref:TylF/MycF/NovP-related O-methyltransferase n=1 Tax=Orrella sp. 11846 TaxID=3409913 RepID=UPI003B59036E